jgi:chemotaxis protein CheZ
MAFRRKVFRIEETDFAHRATARADATATVTRQWRYRSGIARRHGAVARPAAACELRAERARSRHGLEDETDIIHRAIARTWEEIATLHSRGFGAMESGRVFRELDAVIGSAEHATRQILAAAEAIEQAVDNLSGQEHALARDIRDRVIRIFEACNFQDLAGQRIATVVAMLKIIEQQVGRMEIWSGIRTFQPYRPAVRERALAAVAVNGPKLDGDAGHLSQTEIDALFSPGIRSQ